MKKIFFCIFGLLMIGLPSCHKDEFEEFEIIDSFEPAISYIISVEGIVSDPLGNPVANATVSFDGQTQQTDILGHFKLQNVHARFKPSWLKVEAPTFIPSGTNISANSSDQQNTKIILIPEPPSTSFASSEGADIQIDNRASIRFGSKSYLQNGLDYIGNIHVTSFALSADDDHLTRYMPGELLGRNLNGVLTGLQSLGMVYAKLKGENGFEVQLSSSNPAILTVEIPPSFLNMAPNEVPLWYFDEDQGLWIEEGVAKKNGRHYIGEVSHFSWWNIDIPYGELGLGCISLKDVSSKEDLAFVSFEVSVDSFAFGYLLTNENGKVCTSLPYNEIFILTIYNECGNIIEKKEIGPFTSDVQELVVEVNYFNGNELTISGVFLNCDGNEVEATHATIAADQIRSQMKINSDGSFSSKLNCAIPGQEIVISAYDANTQMAGTTIFNLEQGISNYTKTINLCGQESFLIYNDGTGEVFYSDCIIFQHPNEIIIACDNATCLFGIEGTTTGQFNGAISCPVIPIDKVEFTITELSDFIAGSFHKDSINGSFLLKIR